MKKTAMVLTLVFLLVLIALAALVPFEASAKTFPVVDLVTVGEVSPGVVKVSGQPGDVSRVKYLVQYCPDVLRAGCPNNIIINPSEDGGSHKIFHLNQEGVGDGQVAYNFTADKGFKPTWLHIPACNVKTGVNTRMEMSYYDAAIEDSGGAHFVSTSTGYRPTYPVSSGECGQAQTVRSAPKVVVVSASVRRPVSAPKATGCSDCEEEILTKVAEVKEDTVAIRQSVGDVDKTEPVDEQTVQQKTRKILDKTKKIEKAVGEAKPGKDGKQLSLHEKIGEPTKPGETVIAKLDKIEKATAAPWWSRIETWVLLIVALAVIVLGPVVFPTRPRRAKTTTEK